MNPHPAIFTAGSLHGPCPAVPIAAARNQYFVPLVKPVTVPELFVGGWPVARVPRTSTLVLVIALTMNLERCIENIARRSKKTIIR